MAKAFFFRRADFRDLVETEPLTLGYVVFLDRPSGFYSLLTLVTGTGSHFYHKLSEFGRKATGLFFVSPSLKAVPFHHQEKEEGASGANFLTAVEVRKTTEGHFDCFCVVEPSGGVILFEPVGESGRWHTDFPEHSVLEEGDLDPSILQDVVEMRMSVLRYFAPETED